MAIATLLISTMLLKFIGNTGTGGMVASIAIGSVICIIAALAGDTSQDLKTGFLLGATPKKQQIGELVGCLVSSIAIGGILYLLNLAWGYGSLELPAPQATLMKLVVEGVMEGNLPWSLVYIGVFIAVFIEILGIPVLPFAIGLYLPLHLSTPIMAGGLIRVYMEKRKCHLEDEKEERIRNGILYTSGLIAGEGMMGILLALFAIISHKGETLLNRIDLSEKIQFGNIGALIIFFILLLSIIFFSAQKQKS